MLILTLTSYTRALFTYIGLKRSISALESRLPSKVFIGSKAKANFKTEVIRKQYVFCVENLACFVFLLSPFWDLFATYLRNILREIALTHFMSLVSSYSPSKYQKTFSFLMFSGGMERAVAWDGSRIYLFGRRVRVFIGNLSSKLLTLLNSQRYYWLTVLFCTFS